MSAIPKFATFLDNVSPFLHQQGGQIVGLIVFPVWLAQGHSSSWLLESSAVKAEIQYGSYLTEEEHITPDNPIVKEGLAAMLSPYMAKQLHKNEPHQLLKLLTSNSENPYLVWNNGTRSELVDFLEEQRDR